LNWRLEKPFTFAQPTPGAARPLSNQASSRSEGEPSGETSLGARAVSGSFWTAIRIVCEYGLRLGSSLILTRLLVPEAFGLMLIVSVLMTGLAMFSDVGIQAIVVQSKRGDDPKFLDTVWTLQVLRGAILTAFAVALAGPVAAFYDEPQLQPLLQVASLTALVAGFNSISIEKLQRHLRVKKIAAIQVTAQFWGNLVTIIWALLYPSVWALVWGGLVGSIGKMVLTHVMAREHRCRFAWERESIDDVVDFGKWIFVSTILFFLAGQFDRLIFVELFSVANLGVFSIAITLATIPTQVIWRIGRAVVFPALSRRRESESGLAPAYDRARLPLLLAGGFPVIFIASCAPELIEVLYDERYANAGWMLQILAIATWIQIPQGSSGNVLLALGIPRSIAIANGVKFVGLLLCLPFGYFAYGDAGAIAGLAGAEIFRYVTLALAIRRLKLPIWRLDLLISLFVLLVSLVAVYVNLQLEISGHGALTRMTVCLATIVALWLPASAIMLRQEIPRLRQGIANLRARRSAV